VISDESNVYDAVMRLMDQVQQVDRKVSSLMSAAGVEAPEPLPADEAA
jgi:hypothetical protein